MFNYKKINKNGLQKINVGKNKDETNLTLKYFSSRNVISSNIGKIINNCIDKLLENLKKTLC